jgi:hypothetical protein
VEHHEELMTGSAIVRNNIRKHGQDRQFSLSIKYYDNQSKASAMEWACS